MREIKNVLIEGLLVLAVGGVLALAANWISPRGLALARDYFPRSQSPSLSTGSTNSTRPLAGTNSASAAELLAARLQGQGLQVADSNLVAQAFHDPRHEVELFIFVDARNEAHYQEGHVPGAFLFDHYRAENYLASVLPVCLTAEKIIVYCTGGDCEDSEFAAITLRDAGVPKEKLFVYPGGITEWTNHGLPAEIGARRSGLLRPTKP